MVTIQRTTTRKDSKVQVTFTVPATDGCSCLYLVGRFNQWDESVYRMQRTEDATWSVTLEVESDHEFQYRFRTDDGTWLNDGFAFPLFKSSVSNN